METKIDITKDFTMQDIISKEFVLYFRDYIKTQEDEQRICKRDRKTVNHPCEGERKYDPDTATYKVVNNRWRLNSLYEIYYFIKKNKDFDWSLVLFTHRKNYWKEDYIAAPNWIYEEKNTNEVLKDCKLLKNRHQLYWDDLINVIKSYVGKNGKYYKVICSD